MAFNALRNNQRAALLIAPTPDGTTAKSVFIAWASHGDNGQYPHGWIISDPQRQRANVSDPTREAWADTERIAGRILDERKADFPAMGLGNIFGAAGNGSFDLITAEATTAIRCSEITAGKSGITLSDWFTPVTKLILDQTDSDFGVGGAPLILPANRVR